MRSNLGELEQRREYLFGQVGTDDGLLQTELAAVKQKLSAVTADTPTEDVITASQQEAALVLKLTAGKAELKRLESEIYHGKQMENQARELVRTKHQEEQKEIDKALARIAEIDGQLDGTKPFPPLSRVMINGRPSDTQDDKVRIVANLKRERARLVEQFGSPEEHEIRRAKERVPELEAILAGRQRLPELPYIVELEIKRYDFLGTKGHLQQARDEQRKNLEEELTTLQAKIANSGAVPQEAPKRTSFSTEGLGA